jgi:hypothetical protein
MPRRTGRPAPALEPEAIPPTYEELEAKITYLEKAAADAAALAEKEAAKAAEAVKATKVAKDIADTALDAKVQAETEKEAAKEALRSLSEQITSVQVAQATYLDERRDLVGKAAAGEQATQAMNDMQVELAKLRAIAALVKAPSPEPEVLGTILVHENVVIGDTFYFDQKWKTANNVRSRIAVDFKGPNAKYLANRGTPVKPVVLADGTYRIIVPTLPQARGLAHSAKLWMGQNEDTETVVTSIPLQATALQGKDAAREGGAGIVLIESKPVLVSLMTVGGLMKVSATRDSDGQLQTLHLHVP